MAESTPIYVVPLSAQKPKVISLVPLDPGSRYKMRQLQVQVVGKSKMIKTVLVNILDVAKDMQVPPTYIGVFMGYEIGAQAKFDTKKPERQQAFISGEHDTKDLSKIVLKFVNEVVLCPICGLPEIVLTIEGKKVLGKCRACGGNEEARVSNEKFKRYVLNHPPSGKGSSAFSGSTDVQKRTASKKSSEVKSEAKEAKEAKEKNREKPQSKQDEEVEIVWFSDTSDEATRKRREAMLPESLRVDDKEELKELVQSASVEKLTEKKDTNHDSDAVFAEKIFGATLQQTSPVEDLFKHKIVLQKFLQSEEAQLAFLGCLEEFVFDPSRTVTTKFPHILKQLFDEELLEEETILKWSTTTEHKTAQEEASPFIKWLQEAEEESDDEDD